MAPLDRAEKLTASGVGNNKIREVRGDAKRLAQGIKGMPGAAPELRSDRVQSVQSYMGFTRNSVDHPLLPFRY